MTYLSGQPIYQAFRVINIIFSDSLIYLCLNLIYHFVSEKEEHFVKCLFVFKRKVMNAGNCQTKELHVKTYLSAVYYPSDK